MPKPSHLPTESSSNQTSSRSTQSVIGKNLRIKGELSGMEPLHISGSITGTISLAGNLVTVGDDGEVIAQITAGNLNVSGKVRGNVKAEDRVEIRAGGSVLGEVTAPRIHVEDGAFLQGRVHLQDKTKDDLHASAKPERVQCPLAGCQCSYEIYGNTPSDREGNVPTLQEGLKREHADHTSEVLAVNEFRKFPR
jgi:cytoskeletal protein CcmA (bactofilin family)